MNEERSFSIIAPDGSQALADLPADTCREGDVKAPDWLVRHMSFDPASAGGWFLHRLEVANAGERQVAAAISKLCLVRAVTAAASDYLDPRTSRLKAERIRLEKLNDESAYVRVEPRNVLPGSEPEYYRVTFFCRGIIGIDAMQNPIYGEKHEVDIHCDEEFPYDVPRLRWVTDIWHPNIQHDGTKGVCVNKSAWLGGMGLDDLIRMMFEMVQYKNYHAEHTPPFLFDPVVAEWVKEYAEPRGIVEKGKISVDDKPFTQPRRRITVFPHSASAEPPSERRIKFSPHSAPVESPPERRPAIKFIKPRTEADHSRGYSADRPTVRIIKKD